MLINLFTMKMVNNLDHIFENVVGGNSRWQWFTVFLLWPIAFASSFPWLLHLFTSYEVKHRCYVPNCDTPNTLFKEDFINFSLPTNVQEAKEGELFLKAEKYDDCKMYEALDSGCNEGSFSNTTVICQEFVYDRSIFEETLATEFDLVRFCHFLP